MQLSDDVKNDVRWTVARATDLNSSDLKFSLSKKHRVVHPTLQIDQRRISFGEEVLSFHNAPTGVSFTPGVAKAFALYVIPIGGTSSIAHQIMRSISGTDSFGISSDGLLFYKEFADGVNTNEEVQRRVAKNALDKINMAKAMFENAKSQSDTYNESLESFVELTIEDEKEKRQKDIDAKRNLDPFA